MDRKDTKEFEEKEIVENVDAAAAAETEKILPDAVKTAKANGIKIIKIYASDEDGKAYDFYFRKPSKAEYKLNIDRIVSGQMSVNKTAFSMVTHMENSLKRQAVYPADRELSEYLDKNLSCISDFYGKLFGEGDKKLDFLSVEI